jgi:hypothetical protein
VAAYGPRHGRVKQAARRSRPDLPAAAATNLRRRRKSPQRCDLDGSERTTARGTQFRQWAIERLDEYLVKRITLDDQRLRRTDRITDYFDELLARIREIRASEQRVYQRIRESFALASVPRGRP